MRDLAIICFALALFVGMWYVAYQVGYSRGHDMGFAQGKIAQPAHR